MIGGQSTSVGIVLYDTEKSEDNAVFCYFKGKEKVYETGKKDFLIDKMMSLDKNNDYKNDRPIHKFMLIELFAMVILIAAVWIFIGGFFPVFGAVVFSCLGFVPLLSVFYAVRKSYPKEKDLHQFRRFHGAEHMVVDCLSGDNGSFDLSEVKKRSIYHQECGTVYAGEELLWVLTASVSFGLIPEIGFWRFLIIAVVSAVLLFINIFNPLNPFKLLQHNLVEKPNDEELLLAFYGAEILKKMN